MAADVAKFTLALDEAWKNFSTEEVSFGPKELVGLSERGSLRHVEQKFQQQLQRARGTFLQEFRNHSVVVEKEVRKIREEMKVQLETQHREQTDGLLQREREASSHATKLEDEVAHLKRLATSQEAFLSAVRHRWGSEQKDQLKAEMSRLHLDVEELQRRHDDLCHQLICRDELVMHLQGEIGVLQERLLDMEHIFIEQKRSHEEHVRSLRLEMRQAQDQFAAHLKDYEEKFAKYKAGTADQLQLQEIVRSRQTEALQQMEEEMHRHIQARTKPTNRIGDDELEDESRFEAAMLVKDASYRKDLMGMDTSWRDYQAAAPTMVSPGRRLSPHKFRVDRTQLPRRFGVTSMAPVAVDHQLGFSGQAPLSSRDLPSPRRKQPLRRDAAGGPILGLGLTSTV